MPGASFVTLIKAGPDTGFGFPECKTQYAHCVNTRRDKRDGCSQPRMTDHARSSKSRIPSWASARPHTHTKHTGQFNHCFRGPTSAPLCAYGDTAAADIRCAPLCKPTQITQKRAQPGINRTNFATACRRSKLDGRGLRGAGAGPCQSRAKRPTGSRPPAPAAAPHCSAHVAQPQAQQAACRCLPTSQSPPNGRWGSLARGSRARCARQ